MDTAFDRSVREICRLLVKDTGPEGIGLAALREAGWTDILEEDPELAVSVLFEETGRAAALSAAAALIAEQQLAKHLAAGVQPITPAWGRLTGRADGTAVVDALVRGPLTIGALLVVDPEGLHDPALVVAESGAQEVEVGGIDPRARLRRISATATTMAGPSEAVLATDRRLRLAVCSERTGLAQAVLDLALEHVRSRQQFGRPIASYQAVQHRLVDVHVAIEAVRSATHQAWWTPDRITVAVAELCASVAAETAVRAAFQVCGGMGFTEEFGLGILARRQLLLDGLDGGAPAAERRLARALETEGRLPRRAGFSDIDLGQETS